MSKSTYPLKLPASVKNVAAGRARLDGVSVNQFIAAAVPTRPRSLHLQPVTTARTKTRLTTTRFR